MKKITTTKSCPVCENGWDSYSGDYDSLCEKHYLEIEPNEEDLLVGGENEY